MLMLRLIGRRVACLPLALLWLAWPAAESAACSCMRAPVCEARGKADAVFIGRAISGTALVHFDVERAFKGVSVGPTSVSSGDGTCALTFTPGERYLVYAYRHPSGGLA